MMQPHFIEHFSQRLTDFFSVAVSVNHCEPVFGGDINHCLLLATSNGKFFIKTNDAGLYADMFEKEANGLKLLAGTKCIRVPQPLFTGKYHDKVYLVMEHLEKGAPHAGFWEHFAESLAQLHLNSYEQFGLNHDNYVGSLFQSNRLHPAWHLFYAHERILKLVKDAFYNKLLDANHVALAEQLCSKLNSIFPTEKPALLHGDLWSGNFMVAENGYAAVYDPAVYYGHREMDIAMTLLFGGFDRRFYEAYRSAFPLEPGWRQRTEICQLYPLLVHLLLFGGHYHAAVTQILKKYS
jgi:fructosamine-3-kinase